MYLLGVGFMSKKDFEWIFETSFDYKKLLKHDVIEELKWYEEELNELYLYKNRYTKEDINRAKFIIKRMKELEDLCIDKQLDYLITHTLDKIKNLYPEFFDC